MVGKYFLLVCSLFFHPFNRVLNGSKFFNLDEDQCNDVSVYSFENFTFGVKSKNSLSGSGPQSFLLCLILILFSFVWAMPHGLVLFWFPDQG